MLRIVYSVIFVVGLGLAMLSFAMEDKFTSKGLAGVPYLVVLLYSLAMGAIYWKTQRVVTRPLQCKIYLDLILYGMVSVGAIVNCIAGLLFSIVTATDNTDEIAVCWAIGLFWGSFVLMLGAFALGVYVIENNTRVYAAAVDFA